MSVQCSENYTLVSKLTACYGQFYNVVPALYVMYHILKIGDPFVVWHEDECLMDPLGLTSYDNNREAFLTH